MTQTYNKGDSVGLIDEIRKLTLHSREKIEYEKNKELERDKAHRIWLTEKQIPKLARQYYREVLAMMKDQASEGEDGLEYSVEHYGKAARLDEETFPAFRMLRKKLVADGFEVSDIEDNAEKIHDTTGAEEHKISCSIIVQW